jgi:hypothetical protein
MFGFAAGVIALAAFATWAFALDRQTLWSVVKACVADHKLTGPPFPCLKVDLAGGEERGYVVLYAPLEHDTILAPTRKIVGVEDPFLQSSAAPNYFAGAWEAWLNLNGEQGDRRSPVRARSQLRRRAEPGPASHSHGLPCGALDAAAPSLAVGEWSPIGPLFPHQSFWAFRTGTADLGRLDPFRLAAGGFADRVHNLALLTNVVAQRRGANGSPRAQAACAADLVSLPTVGWLAAT